MKSHFFLCKLLGFVTLLLLVIVSIISCGGGGDSNSSPPPNLTGQWVGAFVSNENTNSFEVYFDISKQNGDNFEGTWISSSNANITPGSVDGYVYPSNDSRWLVNLSLYRGSVTCCVPLFGCYDLPRESLDMLGYFENQSVLDEEASHHAGCSLTEIGTLIVSRQQSK